MEKHREFLELESLLRQVSNQLNTSTRRYLAERGMTMARFWVINKLSLDRPLTMGDLHKRLNLSPSTITGLVDNLVEDGVVNRWRDEGDRRLVYLTLTPEGKQLLDEVIGYRVSILGPSIGDGTDINQLNKALDGILDNLKKRLG